MAVSRDAIQVWVEGDYERAVKLFCRKWKQYGISAELKFRANHPAKGGRRRAKACRAESRLKRYLWKRGWYDEVDFSPRRK